MIMSLQTEESVSPSSLHASGIDVSDQERNSPGTSGATIPRQCIRQPTAEGTTVQDSSFSSRAREIVAEVFLIPCSSSQSLNRGVHDVADLLPPPDQNISVLSLDRAPTTHESLGLPPVSLTSISDIYFKLL